MAEILRRKTLVVLGTLLLLLSTGLAAPRQAMSRGFEVGDDDTEGLIQILKDKGILTDQDVEKVQSEVKKKRSDTSLKIQGRIQFRYSSLEDFDTSTSNIRKDANGFRLQRVRLIFKGTAVPQLDYFIHTNWDQGTDGHIWDAFVQYNLDPRIGHLRLGQYKVPFGRQWLTSSTKFLFMNRTNIGDNLGYRRDIGVMLERYSEFNKYQGAFATADMKEPLINYAIGVFNGNHRANGNGFLSGSDSSARIGKGNDNDQYLYVGRLSFTPVKRKEGFKYLTFGANYGFQDKPTNGDKWILDDTKKASFDVTAGEPWVNSDKEQAWGVDSMLILGQGILQAEYIERTLDTNEVLTFTDGTQDDSITAKGWYVQGGYYVLPDKLSLNARYETYDPNDAVTSKNDYDRYALGFNYYFAKNKFKLQGDYTWQKEEENSLSNDSWKLQLQMLF